MEEMINHRLNYCTHAMESMHDLYHRLRGRRHDPDAIDTNQVARDMMVLLERSEKFILPTWGRIFHEDEWVVIEQNVEIPRRLPFPIVACEYHCDYQAHPLQRPNEEFSCSRRIALAVESEALTSPPLIAVHHVQNTNPNNDGLGYYVFVIAYSDDMKLWCPPPVTLFVPRDGDATGVKMAGVDRIIDFLPEHFATLPTGKRAYEKYPPNKRIERMARDLADEVIAINHMLAALSLDHGRHETIPPPEKLNRKRAKKKKPPLFEYKILDIVADVMAPKREGVNYGEGRSHASPRMHTRRGHVRKLANSKTTWIRNTIVGKPGRGQIIKDYSIHHKELHQS